MLYFGRVGLDTIIKNNKTFVIILHESENFCGICNIEMRIEMPLENFYYNLYRF